MTQKEYMEGLGLSTFDEKDYMKVQSIWNEQNVFGSHYSFFAWYKSLEEDTKELVANLSSDRRHHLRKGYEYGTKLKEQEEKNRELQKRIDNMVKDFDGMERRVNELESALAKAKQTSKDKRTELVKHHDERLENFALSILLKAEGLDEDKKMQMRDTAYAMVGSTKYITILMRHQFSLTDDDRHLIDRILNDPDCQVGRHE